MEHVLFSTGKHKNVFRKRRCWMLQEYKILVNIIFQGNIGKEMQATQIFEPVTALPYSSINLISSPMGLKGGHYFAHFTFDKTEIWRSCVIWPDSMASKQGKLMRVFNIKAPFSMAQPCHRSFCTAKETINKMTRQPKDWEKTFANKANYKGLISTGYRELMQLCATQTSLNQKICIDISPKKTYRWLRGTWKDAGHP